MLRATRRFLFGDLPDYREDKLGYLLKVSRERGDLAKLRFGPYTAWLLNHPKHLRVPLLEQTDKYDKFGPGYKFLKDYLRDGLITADGDTWREGRKVFRPVFGSEQMKGFTVAIAEAVEQRVSSWKDSIDIEHEMALLTLDVLTRALIGADGGEPVHAINQSFPVVRAALAPRVLKAFSPPMWLPTRTNRALKTAIGDLDNAVVHILKERREKGSTTRARDLVSILLDYRNEAGQPLSDARIRDELVTMMIAGHETTAAGLCWLFWLLGQHPDALARMEEEILACTLPLADIDSRALPFTNAAFLEALRIYPPIWLYNRRVTEDHVVGGETLRKNDFALMCPYVLHRNPALWKDPEEFRPERFMPNSKENSDRFAFLAFGAGERSCVGARFATTEVTIALASIFRRYRVRLDPASSIVPVTELTLRHEGPLRLLLEPRAS